jgi:hypothetical protein
MKDPMECLLAQLKKHSLHTHDNLTEIDKYVQPILDANGILR